MTFPAVSVVVPAFDAGRTIGEAIQSVLAQSYEDFELVICDDASTDNTSEIVRSFDDERIRLVCNLENQGEGASRNNAIAAAQGEWVAVLDADDAWHPERLSSLLQASGENADRMVFDDIVECHHGPAGLVPWRRLRGDRAYGAHGAPVGVSASEWVRSSRLLIKPLVPIAALRASGVTHSRRRFAADTEFFLNLLAHGLKLRYVPGAYYYYRISPGSMSSIRSRHVQMEEVLEHAATLFSDDPDMVESLRYRLKLERHNKTYSEFLWHLRDRKLSEAGLYALRHPWVITEFTARAMREIPYHAHRISHHGATRGRR